MRSSGNHLGQMLKTRRLMLSQTLSELAILSDVSTSHLARIERGERFPSASILKRIARPLGFNEIELFTAAGYLPSTSPDTGHNTTPDPHYNLDSYVASVLASEPVAKQRAIIGIFNILKAISSEPTVPTGDYDRTSN